MPRFFISRAKRMRVSLVPKLFLLAIVSIIAFPLGAQAHMYSIIPNEFNVAQGKEHTVISSFTMHPMETQYSLQYFVHAFQAMGGYDLSKAHFSGTLVYNDGSRSEPLTFEEYDNPDTTYMEQIGCENTADGYTAPSTIAKSGTVIVESGLSAPFMGPAMMSMYSKHILNIEADGGSMQEVGKGQWEEIIPLTDLAEAQLGQPIKFKILLNGAAEGEREIAYATADTDVVYNEGEQSFTNLEALTKADAEGVFSYTPQCYGTHTLAADMIEINGTYYTSTLSFELSEPSMDNSSGSGGGCSAGGYGALALLAIAPIASRALRKMQR